MLAKPPRWASFMEHISLSENFLVASIRMAKHDVLLIQVFGDP
jgi:hypothetical protein